MDLEDQVKHEGDSNKIFCYVRDDAVPMRPGLNALKGSSHLNMYLKILKSLNFGIPISQNYQRNHDNSRLLDAR